MHRTSPSVLLSDDIAPDDSAVNMATRGTLLRAAFDGDAFAAAGTSATLFPMAATDDKKRQRRKGNCGRISQAQAVSEKVGVKNPHDRSHPKETHIALVD